MQTWGAIVAEALTASTCRDRSPCEPSRTGPPCEPSRPARTAFASAGPSRYGPCDTGRASAAPAGSPGQARPGRCRRARGRSPGRARRRRPCPAGRAAPSSRVTISCTCSLRAWPWPTIGLLHLQRGVLGHRQVAGDQRGQRRAARLAEQQRGLRVDVDEHDLDRRAVRLRSAPRPRARRRRGSSAAAAGRRARRAPVLMVPLAT